MQNWAVLASLLPALSGTGRLWRWPVRAILDGILYVLRTGCAWRPLPLDFPPQCTVHRWFLRLSQAGVFARLAHALTFADLLRQNDPTGLTPGLEAAAATDLDGFVSGLWQNEPAVRATIVELWNNGPVKGQVSRLKLIKRSMYGRAGFDLLRQRVLHAS